MSAATVLLPGEEWLVELTADAPGLYDCPPDCGGDCARCYDDPSDPLDLVEPGDLPTTWRATEDRARGLSAGELRGLLLAWTAADLEPARDLDDDEDALAALALC